MYGGSSLAGDSKPEDYQAGLKDISDRIQAAKDNLPKDADWQDSFFEVGKAIFGAAVDNPTEFLVDYVAKEFVQEIVERITSMLGQRTVPPALVLAACR